MFKTKPFLVSVTQSLFIFSGFLISPKVSAQGDKKHEPQKGFCENELEKPKETPKSTFLYEGPQVQAPETPVEEVQINPQVIEKFRQTLAILIIKDVLLVKKYI